VDGWRVAMLGVGVMLGAVAAALGARAGRVVSSGVEETTVRVVSSGVEETTVRVRVGTATGRYRQARRYAPQVVYAYEAGGRRYEGRRVGLGPRALTSDRGEALRAAGRYPAGSEVTVYYDPEDPGEATLVRGTGEGTRWYWLAAGVALAMAGVVLIVGLR
jgi:hypothetical protein